ncbi:hypothetical protein QOZ80_6AG0532800 [Eleusine coracana subsp. coracana]|nr:hypothetical protein QOZ80_6AG0532800 [Eleusine coracana subsp. coracana]
MPCFVIGAAPHRLFHGTTTPAPRETPTRPPLPPPAPPEVESSDFDFIGVLGEGGFARVFKVRHRRTCEVFALKEAFNPSPDAEEEAEVLRRAASSPSPHVVQCHAVFLGGNDDDNNGALVVSVLELMDAGSLRAVLRRLQRRGFLEPALAEAAHRCLMGLAQLHSRGVAHLDVKPDNFLCNARGDVKIGDFNASRVVYGRAGEALVVPTASRGTARYFSPERFGPGPPTCGDSASPSSSCSWAARPSGPTPSRSPRSATGRRSSATGTRRPCPSTWTRRRSCDTSSPRACIRTRRGAPGCRTCSGTPSSRAVTSRRPAARCLIVENL